MKRFDVDALGADITAEAPAHFDVRVLDYVLPEELIAQEPLAERSASRLLVVDRQTGELHDRRIGDLITCLTAGDVLVLNDTRVVPAKFGLRRPSGGRIEGLFLQETAVGRWDVLLRGAKRLNPGERLRFENDAEALAAEVLTRGERGRWLLAIEPAASATEILERVGRMPLPPYIKRAKTADVRDEQDRERYQTVYAMRHGAVAAPTAGLHLTAGLLAEVEARGVALARVTLHVGYGTFAPVEVADLADHPMHAEYWELSAETAGRLRAARAAGGRIVAVGTTSARVLETAWARGRWRDGGSGWTRLFCYPPYAFGGLDALLTNFHLPRSTLLALVMAFAGVDLTKKAYAHAMRERYRFYSYGDAMLIV